MWKEFLLKWSLGTTVTHQPNVCAYSWFCFTAQTPFKCNNLSYQYNFIMVIYIYFNSSEASSDIMAKGKLRTVTQWILMLCLRFNVFLCSFLSYGWRLRWYHNPISASWDELFQVQGVKWHEYLREYAIQLIDWKLTGI